MSDQPPRKVREGEPTADDEVSLETGREAVLRTIRLTFVGNDRKQQTAAGAATIEMVAQLEELADAAGRDSGRLTSNKTHELLDSVGLSLRVPPLTRSANDQAVYGFYDYQRACLEAIATADAEYEFRLPDDERARRALSYVGAELVAEDRLAAAERSTATGASGDGGADDGGDDFELDEDVREVYERYGFDADVPPGELIERIETTLEEDSVGLVAGRIAEDETSVRAELKAALEELRALDLPRDLRTKPFTDRDRTTDDPSEPDFPDPEEGLLSYDWVSTGNSRWSGRPLRGLLYALLTEEDGLALPDHAVDRVELINYGEPTVRGYELPVEESGLTLKSDEAYEGLPEKTVQHAVDFRVVGDLSAADGVDDGDIENALEQHLNTLQLMARYDSSMEREPVVDERADEPDDVAADGAGPAGTGETAAQRGEHIDLEVVFDRVPEGLWAAMEDAELDYRRGDYEYEVFGVKDGLIGTSRSWQKDR